SYSSCSSLLCHTIFPYTTLFRSEFVGQALAANLPTEPGDDELDLDTLHWHLYAALADRALLQQPALAQIAAHVDGPDPLRAWARSEEHTSELQSRENLVCRLLLE